MPLLLNSPVDKSELRLQARARRRALDVRSRSLAEHAIATHLHERASAQAWRRVAGYAATASETSLAAWYARLRDDLELYLPAPADDGTMSFRRWQPGTPLLPGPFAIEQPPADADAIAVADLDTVLLPLLAFDRHGTRLGSGAGYYDRALTGHGPRAPRPRLIGIAYAAQQFERLPREPWDVPLDAVLTEHGWLELTG